MQDAIVVKGNKFRSRRCSALGPFFSLSELTVIPRLLTAIDRCRVAFDGEWARPRGRSERLITATDEEEESLDNGADGKVMLALMIGFIH